MATSRRTSGFSITIEDLERLCKSARVVLIPLELEDDAPTRKEITSVKKVEARRKKITSTIKNKTTKKKRKMRLKYITPDNKIIYIPNPAVLNDQEAEKYGLTDSLPCHFCSATFLDPEDLKRHETLHIWTQYDPDDPIYQTIDAVIKNNDSHLNSSYQVDPKYQLRQDSPEQSLTGTGTQVLSNVEELKVSKPSRSREEIQLERTETEVDQTRVLNTGGQLSTNSAGDAVCDESSEEARTDNRDTMLKKCVFCGIGFFHLMNLRKHLLQSHSQEESILNGKLQLPCAKRPKPKRTPKYKCSQCDMTYAKPSKLKCHERTHQGKCKYYCAECKCAYNSASCLGQHMKLHNAENPYTCSVCGISFKLKNNYVSHVRIHTSMKPYVCKICGESFKHYAGLSQHKVAVHEKKFNLKCKFCSEEFNRASDLRKHLQAHQALDRLDKKFKCNLCPATFTSAYALKKHGIVHSNERPFLCDTCPLAFKTIQSLNEHKQKHLHPVFQCNVCGRQMGTWRTYTIHLRVKHGIGKEVCDICGVASNNLNWHKRKHKVPEESLKCEQCSYVASTPYWLKDHFRKKHTDEKPFECEVCGQRYSDKRYLKSHLRVHSEKKHFQCSLCPQSYRCYLTLRKHKASHENQDASRGFDDLEEEKIDNAIRNFKFNE